LPLRPRPSPSTLFPYTTLFRSPSGTTFKTISLNSSRVTPGPISWKCLSHCPVSIHPIFNELTRMLSFGSDMPSDLDKATQEARSEEHTSELQSRENLVCRLLLEKKKKKQKNTVYTDKNHTTT